MLNYNVRGENIEITSALRDYVEKKLQKLEKYFDNVPNSTAHVNMKVYSDKSAKVEVTIPLPYLVLRAEVTSPDMYASIDLVTDKLERQIRKYKTKLNRKSREKGFKDLGFMELPAELTEHHEEEPTFDVVRKKHVSLKPMDTEEAILQMNMLGHTFFIYQDAETDGTNIVYRRKDGRFGLIEVE